MRLNRHHALYWLGLVVLLGPWVLLTPWILKDSLATLRLTRRDGVSNAEALVTAVRPRGDYGRIEVRYAFSVEKSALRYTASDSSGRTNLWIPLTRKAGERAVQDRLVTVKYLSRMPSVNRPVNQSGEPVLDALTCCAAAIVGWIVICGGPFIAWRNARLCREGVATQRKFGTWFWIADAGGRPREPAS